MLTKSVGLCAGVCLLLGGFVGPHAAKAQENSPPKILVIDVENLKPGKAGSQHEKTESAFVKAMTDAKWQENYLALEALSGPPRSLFFFRYDSLAGLEKERADERNHPELAAALDRAYADDAELLSSMERSIYKFREDLSHKPATPIAKMRYMEITRVKLRVGHQPEWEEYLKVLSSTLDKSDPERHIAVYQSAYGWENGGVWLLIIPLSSLEEADRLSAMRDSMNKTMGDADAKRFRELAAAAVDHSQRNLFAFDPEMSYVPDSWVKADPTFWQHKAAR
jgi:hypothetical protein